MISFIINHIIFKPIVNFFCGFGGLIRWFIFKIINAFFEKQHPSNIDYYLDYNNPQIDKNGFTIAQKNTFFTFLVFIIFLIFTD